MISGSVADMYTRQEQAHHQPPGTTIRDFGRGDHYPRDRGGSPSRQAHRDGQYSPRGRGQSLSQEVGTRAVWRGTDDM